MTKKLMLIAAAVFGLSLCAAAQNSSTPAGTTSPQPATTQASTKPAKKGKKPSKKPAKKVSKKAGSPAPTTPAAPATK